MLEDNTIRLYISFIIVLLIVLIFWISYFSKKEIPIIITTYIINNVELSNENKIYYKGMICYHAFLNSL